jgi:hypothetical protein
MRRDVRSHNSGASEEPFEERHAESLMLGQAGHGPRAQQQAVKHGAFDLADDVHPAIGPGIGFQRRALGAVPGDH